jgi:uncharacterized protein YbjT (DUF2867 family)
MNLVVGSTDLLGGKLCRLLCAQGSALNALVREASDPGKVVRLAEQVTGKTISVQHVPEEALRAQHGT